MLLQSINDCISKTKEWLQPDNSIQTWHNGKWQHSRPFCSLLETSTYHNCMKHMPENDIRFRCGNLKTVCQEFKSRPKAKTNADVIDKIRIEKNLNFIITQCLSVRIHSTLGQRKQPATTRFMSYNISSFNCNYALVKFCTISLHTKTVNKNIQYATYLSKFI